MPLIQSFPFIVLLYSSPNNTKETKNTIQSEIKVFHLMECKLSLAPRVLLETWRKENRNCGKNSHVNDKKLAHGDRKRCISTSCWLVWKTDKSFLWSKWRRGMSCGETHWQYEVMHAEAGGRKAEFPAYPIPTLHYWTSLWWIMTSQPSAISRCGDPNLSR